MIDSKTLKNQVEDDMTRSNGEYSNPGVLTLRVKDGRTCGLRIFEQE